MNSLLPLFWKYYTVIPFIGKLYALFLQYKDFQKCHVNAMEVLYMNPGGHIYNQLKENNRIYINIYFYFT